MAASIYGFQPLDQAKLAGMVHAFLDFELDEERFELRSQGELIPTQGRVFAMIAYLLHARDRVVGKAELMRALWKDTVVGEAAISQVVMLARKALRDEGESQRVIRTIRGRGFRFVAQVREPDESKPSTPQRSTPPPSLQRETRTPLLGRARELDELLRRLAQAEAGVGGLVMIEGEPGIGKTTLAEELAAQALERGIEVIWGRAWEEGGAPPFWPWIQVLRALTQREDPTRLRSHWNRSAAELMPLLPELAEPTERRSELPSLLRGEDLDGSRARFRQFDAIARLLRNAGGYGTDATPEARPPRLIILDDLHAADDASIQLTRFLMSDLREMGLLLVGTYRDLELANKNALASLVESCGDNTLRLRGLCEEDISQLLAQKLGSASPPRWTVALHRLSAGNPLLVGQLCNRVGLDDPGPLFELTQLADFALPERIASAVRRHLSELPAEAREALSAASALGREFSLPLLSAQQGCSEAELLETLAPALRQGVVRPAANGVGRLSFSHALVCNTVYAQLAPQQRLLLHRGIAELLEQQGNAGRPPLYEIAHHFYLAAAGGCRRKAIDYAQRAAVQAYTMMAYETAGGLYDRALQLAEHEALDSLQWHELLCAAGNAWSRSGELERARARFDRAANLARAEHEPERFASAVILCASALRGTMMYDRAQQERLREARVLLPPGDSELNALVLSASTLGLRSADSLAERESTTRAAIEMARRLGGDEILQWTLNARHLVMWGVAPPQDMIAIANEMLELSRRTGESELLLDALLWRMTDYGELGDIQASLRDRRQYLANAERFGSPWHRYMALNCDIFEAMALANFARARELSERARTLGVRIQDSLAQAFHALRCLFLDFCQGLTDHAIAGPLACAEPPSCVPADYRPFWALSWADAGHTEATLAAVEEVLALERKHLLLDAVRRQTLAVMAQACALLEERGPAAELYRALLPSSGLRLHLQAGLDMGPVDYYLGLLARLLDDRAAAAAHLTRAMQQCEMSRPVALYSQYEYGQLLALDDAPRARALLCEVQTSAAQLGMAGLQERARVALGG